LPLGFNAIGLLCVLFQEICLFGFELNDFTLEFHLFLLEILVLAHQPIVFALDAFSHLLHTEQCLLFLSLLAHQHLQLLANRFQLALVAFLELPQLTLGLFLQLALYRLVLDCHFLH
jgi:hypothetical protein